MSEKLAVGVDIGGTYIKSALVSDEGVLLESKLISSYAQESPEKFLDSLFSVISYFVNKLNQNQKLLGIGIGAPGNVNRVKGSIAGGAYNAPALQGLSITQEIKRKYNVPAYLDNDATNAAKGEFLFGAGKEFDHLLAMTLGTGIGGGLILNRKVFHGITDYAGEIGHMTLIPNGVLCSCGNYGCFEAYSSATAMIISAKEAIKRNYSSKLLDVPIESIDGEIICRLAQEGDPVCVRIIKSIAYYIGIASANVINLLNIPLIVIGGGISGAGNILFDAISETTQLFVLPNLRSTFQIVPAQFGNDAGVIGSASTVFLEGETEY